MSSFNEVQEKMSRKFKVNMGSQSDIGPNRENQDDCYVVDLPLLEIYAAGVLDGHSRFTGKLIANAGREFMKQMIENNTEVILRDPVGFMADCFERLQEHIQYVLIEDHKKQGYEIMIEPSGVILKKFSGLNNWSIVSGGTTKTLVLIVKDMMYIANVGDSSALLCSSHPVLKREHLHYEMDAFAKDAIIDEVIKEDIPSFTLELIGDHSVENECEYKRIKQFAPSDTNPNEAKACFVYDDNNIADKCNCKPIFKVGEDGILSKLHENIKYFKNIRKEASTYITSPIGAKYPNSLAFTRTVGDFGLMEYGVTHKPEIQSVNLQTVFGSLKNEKEKTKDTSPDTMCVIVASDGVWDNWEFKTACEFVMYDNCVERLVKFPETAGQDVTKSFMARNDVYAKQNFGGSADNATAVIMYITKV
jgi:serine/threonine protein phosphatase PrpC